MAGITLFAAGMFLAAWSTYGFETAVCYTGEFKNPKTDTFKAIFYSGLLCVVVYTLVPFAFQGTWVSATWCIPRARCGRQGRHARGVLGHAGAGNLLRHGRRSGDGEDGACRPAHRAVVVIMLILALVLSLMTSMAGSSRTLYQASLDGWLPKYLTKVNKHGRRPTPC